jgi:PIN domain nuclease of toxin-antitoxin system
LNARQRPPGALLLDTCAVIWLANGDPLTKAAADAIDDAGQADGVLISPISAWEVGFLSRPSAKRKSALRFAPDPKSWFARVMAGPGIREAPFTADIAIDASHLPGILHNDPADRLLIATARRLDLPIVTRDHRMIAYARTGHLRVVPC